MFEWSDRWSDDRWRSVWRPDRYLAAVDGLTGYRRPFMVPGGPVPVRWRCCDGPKTASVISPLEFNCSLCRTDWLQLLVEIFNFLLSSAWIPAPQLFPPKQGSCPFFVSLQPGHRRRVSQGGCPPPAWSGYKTPCWAASVNRLLVLFNAVKISQYFMSSSFMT